MTEIISDVALVTLEKNEREMVKGWPQLTLLEDDWKLAVILEGSLEKQVDSWFDVSSLQELRLIADQLELDQK